MKTGPTVRLHHATTLQVQSFAKTAKKLGMPPKICSCPTAPAAAPTVASETPGSPSQPAKKRRTQPGADGIHVLHVCEVHGDDENVGSATAPFKTVAAAHERCVCMKATDANCPGVKIEHTAQRSATFNAGEMPPCATKVEICVCVCVCVCVVCMLYTVVCDFPTKA